VDVRTIKYGIAKVKAHSADEAMELVRHAHNKLQFIEEWKSIEMEPVSAKIRNQDFTSLDVALSQL